MPSSTVSTSIILSFHISLPSFVRFQMSGHCSAKRWRQSTVSSLHSSVQRNQRRARYRSSWWGMSSAVTSSDSPGHWPNKPTKRFRLKYSRLTTGGVRRDASDLTFAGSLRSRESISLATILNCRALSANPRRDGLDVGAPGGGNLYSKLEPSGSLPRD